MTNTELQQAIDKTRTWLCDGSIPSNKAKDDATAALAELQKIQVTRAAMTSAPTLTQRPGGITYPTDADYMAAMGPCGK